MRIRFRSPARPVVLLLALAVAPVAAAAEDELLDSIYTESGFELRTDDRLFALFCALNAVGFERAETSRDLPFPKRVFHPIRRKIRDALAASPNVGKSRAGLERFLDAHPVALDRYVEAVLALGDAPEFTPGDGFPAELAGLETLLKEFAGVIQLGKVSRALAHDFRAELKRLRDVADGPFAGLRGAYRLNEESAAPLILLPNPMDGAEGVFAFRTADDTHVIVVGIPGAASKVDLQPALQAYSRLLAAEALGPGEPSALAETVEQLRTAALLPAGVTDGRSLVLASLQAAVAAKLWAPDAAAAVEARFREGHLLAREFAKALEEPAEAFPAEKGPFAQQVAARFDAKKTLAELLKPVRK